MKVKLYDLMGVKSGMNFYTDAFYKLLVEHNIQSEILSNFSHAGKKQQLPNIFVQSPVKKLLNLFLSYFKLLTTIIKLKKGDYVVILLYGVVLDIPLFLLSKLSRKVIFDIHEIVALDYKNSFFKKTLYSLYRTCPNKFIVHSDKISKALTATGFKGQILFVPLFHYESDVIYNVANIADDVKNVFEDNARHFLFFGNIRPSKGIFDLLAAAELLKDDQIKIIVAGQDIFNKILEYQETHVISSNVKLILRLINDDEMKYLFAKCDMTLLPYEDISQSAVLETAVSFKIPLLTSNINYFKTIIANFPSFGKYTETTNPAIFANSLNQFASEDIKGEFYTEADVMKFHENDKFEAFIKELKELPGGIK